MRLLKKLAKTGMFTSSNVCRLKGGATRTGRAVGFSRANPTATTGTPGKAYHYLCFEYAGKYYAGCRSTGMRNGDIEREISKFCCELDLGA